MLKALMRQVWRRNRRDIARFALVGIIGKFSYLAGIRLFGNLLDGVTGAPVAPSLLWLYAGLLILAHTLFYLQNHPEQRLTHGIRHQLKLDALAKMATIDLTAWQKLGTGMLVERIEAGAQAGSDMAVNFFVRVAADILPEMTFSLIFIALVDVRVALYALAGYAVVFAVSRLMLNALYRQKERVLTGEEALSRLMVRGLMEMPVFRLNGWYGRELNRARGISREIVGGKTRIMMIHEAFFALFAVIVVLFKAALIGYGFATRSVTVGGLAMLVAYLDSVYQPIAVFNVLYVEYKLNSLSYRRYLDVLSATDTPNLTSGEPAPDGADIRFERVRCAYDGRDVYRDLSFTVEAGRVVGVAGESGAGKTSMLRQLTGLLPTADGRILVGGRDVSNMNLSEYYKTIAYLPQEAPVFDGTVRENLTFGAPVTDERLYQALGDACLASLMDRLSQGLDTPIGEKGVMLSGGERQRLALARLFLNDSARVVVLDEATSALDPATEEKVLGALLAHLRGRTVLLVAHRLSALRAADEVLLLTESVSPERGSFERLRATSPRFRALLAASGRRETE